MMLRCCLILIGMMIVPCSIAYTSILIKDNLDVRVPPYMNKTLRDQVDEMRRDVAVAPTKTPEQITVRARLLWQWANAYALTGRALHPSLPQVISRVLQGEIRPRAVANFAPYIDAWYGELSFRDAHPNAIGKLISKQQQPSPADSYAELQQTYTVGDAPVQVGGGFLVATRSYAGSLAIQNSDPKGIGYVSVTSSNPNVTIKADVLPVSGMFSGSLGAANVPRPYFKVTDGTLQAGDVVTITAGDQRQGSPGIKLPSQANSAHRIRVFVSLQEPVQPEGGAALLFSMNEVPFESTGLESSKLRGFGPSIVATGESVLLSVRAEDQFRNRATSGFQSIQVFNGKRRIAQIKDRSKAYHEFQHRFDEPGVYYLTARSSDGKLVGEFNPILVEDSPRQRVFWGETHGHTGFAEGSGTVDNFFRFSREDARLDFMTLSEHDLWMDDWEWAVLRKHVIDANEPGRFVTFLGYEWTTPPTLGGHHNVLFRTPHDRIRVERQRAPELALMHSTLMVENNPSDVLVIPHAHNPGRWWQSEPAIEHLVEIVSNHGTFEWLGQAFLAQGYHIGFIGGSDDHLGHPGLRSLSSERPGSDNMGGMAAVFATDLSNDAIFDGMRHRQTYATNGQKIILQARVNNAGMGQVLPALNSAEVSGRTIGTSAVRYVDLIRNGELVRRLDYANPSAKPTGQLSLRFYSDSNPQQRDVRSRGHRYWAGTIKVDGATLLGVSTPDTENVFTEGATVAANDSQTVDFNMRTRGAYRTMILSLAGVTESAQIALVSNSRSGQLSRDVRIASLSGEGELIDATVGENADEIMVQWIAPSSERDRAFSFSSSARPGDTFYVRVIQGNGGMAWSSPVKMTGGPGE